MKDYPICSICKVRTEKGSYEGEFTCPECARVYVPDREIVEYEDEFVTSHSDEMPQIEGIGGGIGAIAVDDGRPADELYKTDSPFSYKPKSGEHLIEEDIYIPDV